MTKKTILLIMLLAFAGLCFGAAVTSDPWTGAGWNTGAPNDEALVGNSYLELQDLRKGVELRANREHVTYASSSAGGWHRNGSAVCYEGTTEEPNLPDDSAALSNIARDRGRLWLDDNFDPPVLKRWDGSAYEVIGTIASGSAPKAYLISDANEDTDGGRESKIIFKGEKDDDTSHELIMIQGSHDGTGDDYKADLILFLNDGDDAAGSLTEVLRIDSAKLATFAGAMSITGDFAVNTDKFTITAASGNTLVAGTLDVTGNIDPTTYETTNGGFLDEDDMASDANDKTASQQSIKAYVDTHGVVQIVNTQTGAVDTGTTIIPYDDTIPQITEGDEYMTLAITPTSATNKLKIEVVLHCNAGVATAALIAALFQDDTAGALAVGCSYQYASGEAGEHQIVFTYYMTAGTTSETTFRVRAGLGEAGTLTFNGYAGDRKFGDILASSITITEIKG